MSWIVGGILAILVLWLIGRIMSDDSKKSSPQYEQGKDSFSRQKRIDNNQLEEGVSKEAQEIVEKVTTIQQFRSLQKKLENAENRMLESQSERSYDNTSRKHDVLQEAVNIAEKKIYQWQFVPSVDLFTLKIILEHAYKVYSNEEYQELKKTLSDENDWYGIDGYGEKEDPESSVKSLLKFRTIVESDQTKEEKIKKINQLVSRDNALKEEFFDSESELKPGDWWFAEQMFFDGLPFAHELYSEGYDTPEKCLDIDPDKFLSRKGVGPKKLEQLKEFQSKVRSQTITA